MIHIPENNIKVLVIDDDNVDFMLVKRLLLKSDLNCAITHAQSHDSAIELCKHEKYDCVFVDYNIASDNGLETAELLFKMHPYMAIIMVTGKGDESLASEAFKLGISDYLPKSSLSIELLQNATLNAMKQSLLQKKMDQQREDLLSFSQLVVHDFMSPALVMQSICRRMERDINSDNYEKIQSHCEHLNNLTNHSVQLLQTLQHYNQVLDTEIECQNLDMNKILAQVIDIHSLSIEEKNATITSQSLPHIYGDQSLLSQLLQNLIGNALKYCDKPSPKIQISFEESDEAWSFAVQDNGIGIDEEHLKKIFEPFKRLHHRDEYTGSGLGLATCKRIIEKHRGEVWCVSTQGKGTTFHFTIPKSLISNTSRARSGT